MTRDWYKEFAESMSALMLIPAVVLLYAFLVMLFVFTYVISYIFPIGGIIFLIVSVVAGVAAGSAKIAVIGAAMGFVIAGIGGIFYEIFIIDGPDEMKPLAKLIEDLLR